MTETTITLPRPPDEVVIELRDGLSALRSEFQCEGDDMTDHEAALLWLDQIEEALGWGVRNEESDD